MPMPLVRRRSGCEAPGRETEDLNCVRTCSKGELRPRQDDASSHNTASRRPKHRERAETANLPCIQQAQKVSTLYSRSEPRRLHVAHRGRPHLPQVLRGAVAQLLFAQGLKGYLRSRQ